MSDRSPSFRIVVKVGDEKYEGPWTKDEEKIAAELALIQDAQVSNDPIRLTWLGVGEGSKVEAAHVQRQYPPSVAVAGPQRWSAFTRDMNF
jgi:hypothetical protein